MSKWSEAKTLSALGDGFRCKSVEKVVISGLVEEPRKTIHMPEVVLRVCDCGGG